MSREAMIGSYLQHPNIVETLEFNEADGRMFLALEFIEGQTVEQLLAQSKERGEKGIPLDLALEIQAQILKGLSYAHNLPSPDTGERMGIIHRDLKPGNIMVSRHGVVKVMDFGIAKAKVAAATITAAGQVRGTPIYMAPEQVMGKPLDARCDQFAAATVLFELVTGEQLFIARNLIEIMRRVSRAEVGDACKKLNRYADGLGDIAGRMWKVEPENRYEDCADAARDLEDLLPAIKAALARGESLTPTDDPPASTAEAASGKVKKPNLARLGPAGVDTTRDQVLDDAPADAPAKKKKKKRGVLTFLGLRKAKPEPPPKRKKKRRRKGDSQPMRSDGGTGRKRKRKRRPDQAESSPIEVTRPDPPAEVEETVPADPPKPPEPELLVDSKPPLPGGRLEPNPMLAEVADAAGVSATDLPEPALLGTGEETTEKPDPSASDSLQMVWEDTTFGEGSKEVEPVSDRLTPMSVPSSPALRKVDSPKPDQLDWQDKPKVGLKPEDEDSGDDEGDDEAPTSGQLDPFFFED